MPDDQNTTQNPISTENSIPPNPQEPMADAPIPPINSEHTDALPEALEEPGDDFIAKSRKNVREIRNNKAQEFPGPFTIR